MCRCRKDIANQLGGCGKLLQEQIWDSLALGEDETRQILFEIVHTFEAESHAEMCTTPVHAHATEEIMPLRNHRTMVLLYSPLRRAVSARVTYSS